MNYRERGRPRPHSSPASGAVRARRLVIALTFLAIFASASAAPSPHVLLLDAAITGRDIVAVGERGTILRSADSGQNWTILPAPTQATLTAIAFAPNARRGWIVGHDALILATTDAGQTWQKQWQGENLESSFLDVCALDPQHVIAVGAYGLYLETEDGGRTWTPRKVLDDDMHLNRLSRGPTGTLYLAGERGTLLRSRDRGATWDRIDSPYDGSFYGILPLGEKTLLAHGLRGRVYRSTDDGEVWHLVPLDQPMLIATAIETKSGAILLAGQSRAFYVSHDHGGTFSAAPLDFTDAIAELLETPDGRILAVGEAGATTIDVVGRGLPPPPPAPPSPRVAARLSARSP